MSFRKGYGFDIYFNERHHEDDNPCDSFTFDDDLDGFLVNLGNWQFFSGVGNPQGCIGIPFVNTATDEISNTELARVIQSGDTIEFDYRFVDTLGLSGNAINVALDIALGTIQVDPLEVVASSDTGWLHSSNPIDPTYIGEQLTEVSFIQDVTFVFNPTSTLYIDNITLGQDCG
jgi:hypothetical protein